MGKKIAQPEFHDDDPRAGVALESLVPKQAGAEEAFDEVTKLMEEIAQLRATQDRDLRLCCDGCRERVGRAHAGDERERNARYPEASQE